MRIMSRFGRIHPYSLKGDKAEGKEERRKERRKKEE